MSEEERIINSIKPIVNARKTHKDNNLYSLQLNAYQLDMIQGLLDIYQKEKEKNKVYTELLKQNENKSKIKTCMTHNLPDNAEIICMIREDFERNFGNDYVSKDKIREFKNKFIKDSKNEKVFMTQSSQINASLIQFCNELLEERN